MNPKSIMSVGFIVGMNREREYWQNKIKEKIENETIDISGFECIAIDVLQELLKGE